MSAHLKTPWTDKVGDKPWQEYPRPQFVRDSYLNLNGWWDYAITNVDEFPAEYDGKILVSWEGYEDKAKTIPKFSHRHLVADWLRKNGYTVVQLDPITRKRGAI